MGRATHDCRAARSLSAQWGRSALAALSDGQSTGGIAQAAAQSRAWSPVPKGMPPLAVNSRMAGAFLRVCSSRLKAGQRIAPKKRINFAALADGEGLIFDAESERAREGQFAAALGTHGESALAA